MKTTIDRGMFGDAFRDYGRGDSFSYKGLDALFEYLEELEEGTGEEIELDAVGLCCDFSEYETALEAAIECGFKAESTDTDEMEEEAREYLRYNTTLIEFEGGVIVQGF